MARRVRIRKLATAGLGIGAVLGFAATAIAICNPPTTGPDVIVSRLTGPGSGYTGAAGVAGFQAYAVGTDSLNIGNEDLEWFSTVNRHPVIAQNMYRFSSDVESKTGRLEMIGMSWLKHGFTALALGSFCSNSCTFESGHSSGSYLGMGCRDPYDAGLNGQQSRLGPRGLVNAFTGFYPHDTSGHPAGTAPSEINKRLQVLDTDMDPALNTGALYFVEGHYISPDDAAAGNGLNNASYRPVVVDADRNLSFAPNAVNRCRWATGTEPAYCESPAIFAWQVIDPEVQLMNVDVPFEGRFHVAQRTFDNGDGTWHYEYAIHNMNSDRSARAFTVDFPGATTITGQGFHGVPHHSGDCLAANPPVPGDANACGLVIDDADWTAQLDEGAGAIAWSTDDYATAPQANALRWGTMFNFWFDANRPPAEARLAISLFKPGDPSILYFDFAIFNDDFETGDPSRWSEIIEE
jgi:hypothetical protein